MARTYIPTLLKIIDRLCFYMERYEMTIREHLTESQNDLFTALLVACDAFHLAMGSIPEEN